ncbi:MAG: hypothetical protein M1812_000183 [Candelaria pacifica]|nr:MAG: hypothetical protein M1812_000183 [Candelaria pacifica]
MGANYWSKAMIQQKLAMDDNQYRQLYVKLETEMSRSGLIGNYLNTTAQKDQLQELLRDDCLKALAKRCNTNYKKRSSKRTKLTVKAESGGTKHQVAPTIKESMPSFKIPEVLEKPMQPVMNVMMEVEHASNGTSTMIRPHALCRANKPRPNKPTRDDDLDDLDYKSFIHVLEQSKLLYKETTDVIIYNPPAGMEKVFIGDEETWKAALLEMYVNAYNRYTFCIEHKTSSPEGDSTKVGAANGATSMPPLSQNEENIRESRGQSNSGGEDSSTNLPIKPVRSLATGCGKTIQGRLRKRPRPTSPNESKRGKRKRV